MSGNDRDGAPVAARVHRKKIGFLSFGQWHPHHTSRTRTGGDALIQSVELAVAAEELGIDGAYYRVHHFAQQLASPFPLLAAAGARTSRIELGTAVIDMRYENPLYMAEDAAAADLLSGGRLQLGLSRGSNGAALNGPAAFGFVAPDGLDDIGMSHQKTALFRAAISGEPVVHANPEVTDEPALPIQPVAPGLDERIWWGAGTRASGVWAAQQGMHLMSSTLLTEDTGVPFDILQREQIDLYRAAWADTGWEHEPRVCISRSVIPIITDLDRELFGNRDDDHDQVGYIGGLLTRFGKSFTGEPDAIAAALVDDAALAAADTLLLTVPNQLGVEYNARMLETIAAHIAPAIDWERTPH